MAIDTITPTDAAGKPLKMVPVTAMEEPTCMLRWVTDYNALVMNVGPARKLQQAWKITTIHDGSPVAINHDWRDVPFEPNP